ELAAHRRRRVAPLNKRARRHANCIVHLLRGCDWDFRERAAVDWRANHKTWSRATQSNSIAMKHLWRTIETKRFKCALKVWIHRLVLLANHAAAESRGHLRLVILAKPIRKEVLHGHLLLSHQTAPRQFPGRVQIEHRANAGRRRNLDRTPHLVANLLMINLT